VVSCPTEPKANVADSPSEASQPAKIAVDEGSAGKLAEGGPARPPRTEVEFGNLSVGADRAVLNMQEDRAGKVAGWPGPGTPDNGYVHG
jgi:hypothetical protein